MVSLINLWTKAVKAQSGSLESRRLRCRHPCRPRGPALCRQRPPARESRHRRTDGLAVLNDQESPRSPWQNPYVERLIGSLRRECLDHVLIYGERDLRRILTLYSLYYNETRTHLGLGKDAPLGPIHRAIWDHRHHANLVRIASSLRADMIFRKNSSPAIVPAGMMGDRADVIFASPDEISGFITRQC